jgi:hypothetical protein
MSTSSCLFANGAPILEPRRNCRHVQATFALCRNNESLPRSCALRCVPRRAESPGRATEDRNGVASVRRGLCVVPSAVLSLGSLASQWTACAFRGDKFGEVVIRRTYVGQQAKRSFAICPLAHESSHPSARGREHRGTTAAASVPANKQTERMQRRIPVALGDDTRRFVGVSVHCTREGSGHHRVEEPHWVHIARAE